MQKILLSILLIFILVISTIAQSTDEQSIRTILAQQTLAWNNGNQEAFMKGYWQSDSLMFIGKSGITYGWQKTLDNYKTSGRIKIEGVKRWGANNYLPGYYKMKKKLNLPVFIKTLAKKAYPFYKNYKDSKQPIVFETILNTLKP